jgi:hypothetical protein
MDLSLEILLLFRLLCAIPRPYYWVNSWKKFTHARFQPTPDMITQELIQIYNNPLPAEKVLLYLYYVWLGVSSVVALFTPYRTELCSAVWKHMLYNFACIVGHRIICIVMFYSLIHSDIPRGAHLSVINSNSKSVPYTTVEAYRDLLGSRATEGTPECSICYADYSSGDSLRILPCCHDFHQSCIDQWLTRHRNRCPMCQVVVGKSKNL